MNKLELMTRVKLVPHKNRRILLYDFSGLESAEQTHELIDYASSFIEKLPRGSVLTLTDISGSNYDKTITDALKELSKHNKPYVKAGAAVGVSGLKKIVFRAILSFSGRSNLKMFDTVEEAKDWLVAYPD